MVREQAKLSRATLASWRFIEVRALARTIRREQVLSIAGTLLVGVTVIGARRVMVLEPDALPTRLVLECGVAGVLFVAVYRTVRHWEAARIVAGPLLRLAFDDLRIWRLFQATALVALPILLVVVAFATQDLARGLSVLVAAIAGLALAAGLTFWLDVQPATPAAPVLPNNPIRERSSQTGHWLAARLQNRRWRMALFMLAAGAAAAALARRNNPDPAVANVLVASAGLIAGLAVGHTDVALVRFLGREAPSLQMFFAQVVLPAAVLTGIATGAAGLLIGIPLTTVVAVGGSVGLALCLFQGAVVLHALAGRARLAAMAAGIDLAVLGVIGLTFAPLAVIWAPFRAIMLWRLAGRRRWFNP